MSGHHGKKGSSDGSLVMMMGLKYQELRMGLRYPLDTGTSFESPFKFDFPGLILYELSL